MEPKKSSFVSGTPLGEHFLSLTRPHSRICIRIYTFNFKKETNKQKKSKNTKNAKEKKISQENRLKKINLRPPVWIIFLSPAFPGKRIFFFLAWEISNENKKVTTKQFNRATTDDMKSTYSPQYQMIQSVLSCTVVPATWGKALVLLKLGRQLAYPVDRTSTKF